MPTVTTAASIVLPTGCTFCPPDHQLTDVYLERELAGHPIPATLDFVHHVDVYTTDPEHLVEKLPHAPGTGKGDKSPPVWYFVSPVRSAGGLGSKTSGGRKARAVVGGTWHEENKKAVAGSTLGGFVKTFTYVKKSSGSGRERLGWIMKEYDISPQNGGGNHVLCKIYRTPRRKNSSSSSSDTSGDSKKRKAASHHPDAPSPSAPRPNDHHENHHFKENVGHVFMERSGDSRYYGAAAYFYGAAAHMPGCKMTRLPPCVQESFLPFYGTAHMQGGGDLVFPPLIQDLDAVEELLNQPSDYQPSEEEIQAMMRELSS